MTIHDIENMSAADLKAQRKELTEAIKAASPDDLAARYVQARLDAKMRDEKLAEQGVTITNLNSALMAAQEKAASLEQDLAQQKEATHAAQQVLTVARSSWESAEAGYKADIAEARNATAVESKRADKAEKLAAARRAVLADLMSRIAPLLAQE